MCIYDDNTIKMEMTRVNQRGKDPRKQLEKTQNLTQRAFWKYNLKLPVYIWFVLYF